MKESGTRAVWVQTAAASLSLLLLFFAVPLRAADAPPAKLSLADAVRYALNINPNLTDEKASYETSLSRLRVAAFDTQFSVGGVTDVSRNPSDSGLSGRIAGGATYKNLLGTEASLGVAPFGLGNQRGSLSLSLRHPLTQGRGLLSSKGSLVEGARINAGVQDKQVYLTTQATVIGVVEAYFHAVMAAELVKVQEKAVSIAEKAADGAHKRAAEGLIVKLEVSRADIRVAQTKDDLNLQQQEARSSLDRLMIAIGSGVGQTPELTDTVPPANVQLPPLADALQTALKNRSELSVYDLKLSDQERKLAVAKDQMRPAFDMVAGLDYDRDEAGIVSGSLLNQGDLTAGVEMRFPLDKRVFREEKATAERDLDVLRNLRSYQMERIAEQVREAYQSVEAAQSSMDILSQNLEVAEQNKDLAQRMVDEGLTSNRDLLDAQESLTRVESGLLRAKIDVYLAGVNLKYAMGEDLTDMGSR